MLKPLLFAGCAALLLPALAAHADTMTTYQLTVNDFTCSGGGCSTNSAPTGSYGTVTVDQSSVTTATITVDLAAGYTFNNAGDALEFEVGTQTYPTGNLPSGAKYPLEISDISSGFELDTPPPAGSDFGPFNVGVTCHYTAGACDTAASTADTLTFTVTSTDGYLDFLESADGAFFAADVTTAADYQSCNSKGVCTIKSDTYQGDVAATPEPSSLVLLGTGLLGFAGTLRRRWRA